MPLAFTSAAAWGTAAYLAGSADGAVRSGSGSDGRRIWYGIAVVGVLGTMGFTRLAMMGVIGRLLEISEMVNVDGGSAVGVRGEEVVELLASWKGMNFVRSALAFGGGVAGLWAMMGF